MSDKNKTKTLADLPITRDLQLAAENAKPIDPMERPLWEIDDAFLNPNEELPPTLVWGTMADRPAIERQGIITISAKPKMGKSMAVYALVSAIVSGTPIDTYVPGNERPRLVIIFDTEMNKPTLQKRLRPIYAALGDNAKRLMVVPLLSVAKSQRIEYIAQITDKYNPDIVAFDVVTKLVNDFNSSEENSAFGDWVEKYAAKRTLFCVIHQNKGKEDTNMKGHLGSILGEAAVENYSASRKDGIFNLTPVNARNSDAEGAPGVSFVYTSNGAIVGGAQRVAEAQAAERDKWRTTMKPIFGEDQILTYTQISKRIVDKMCVTKDGAKDKIAKARECGAIVKIGNENRDPYALV